VNNFVDIYLPTEVRCTFRSSFGFLLTIEESKSLVVPVSDYLEWFDARIELLNF
jgi:hypothetical protein